MNIANNTVIVVTTRFHCKFSTDLIMLVLAKTSYLRFLKRKFFLISPVKITLLFLHVT